MHTRRIKQTFFRVSLKKERIYACTYFGRDDHEQDKEVREEKEDKDEDDSIFTGALKLGAGHFLVSSVLFVC